MYRLGTAGLDAVIEGAGLETAVQQWEARPKALRPIDVEWRTKAVRDSGRKDRTSTEAADLDGDEDKNNGSSSSSSADSEEEDEVAEVTTMEEEKGDAAERVDGDKAGGKNPLRRISRRYSVKAVQDAAAAWEESSGARKSAAVEGLGMPLSGI